MGRLRAETGGRVDPHPDRQEDRSPPCAQKDHLDSSTMSSGQCAGFGVPSTQIGNKRIFAAQGASGVFLNSKNFEVGVQTVINEKLSDERAPDMENELQNLSGLHEADLSGNDPQNTDLASCESAPGARDFGYHTPKAGAASPWIKHARLSFKLDCGSEDKRFSSKECCIIKQEFCGEVVRAVHDNVIFGNDPECVLR